MARYVAWFSCGAASAVLAKMAVEQYGTDCVVAHCDTLSSEHPDNARFFADVQRWLGVPIVTLRSAQYRDIDDVFLRTRYMSGRFGARCTTELKKLPRVAFSQPGDVHLFGYTAEEQERASEFEQNNPDVDVEWLLIDRGVTKHACIQRTISAGIMPPKMYLLGFEHNNCLGCVKATSPRYWNMVRRHFPEVFDRRAQQSRLLGVRLAKHRRQRVYLDELPADATGPREILSCGPMCQPTRRR